MAVQNAKSYSYQKHAFGSFKHKNLLKFSYGYTPSFKKVAAGAAAAIHAAITSSFSAQTVTTSITDPDVPRVLGVTPGGTAANIGNGIIVITGTNVEGATITDNFQLVDGDTTQIVGTKAFRTVTSIAVPACEGTAATFTIDTTNRLGLNHRLFPGNTTVKVVQDDGTTASLQNAPTVNDWDDQYVEKNFITPATTPDGTTYLEIHYVYDSWTLGDINDDPKYLTTTSTSSTSTSTSTSSITTSTSSTSTSSTSTSSTSSSISTSSTSSSTSSTSTSTTTVP